MRPRPCEPAKSALRTTNGRAGNQQPRGRPTNPPHMLGKRGSINLEHTATLKGRQIAQKHKLRAIMSKPFWFCSGRAANPGAAHNAVTRMQTAGTKGHANNHQAKAKASDKNPKINNAVKARARAFFSPASITTWEGEHVCESRAELASCGPVAKAGKAAPSQYTYVPQCT